MAQGATPSRTVQIFASGDATHRVVRVPQNEVDAGQGKAREVHPGLVYEFEDGQLVIDDEVRARDRRFFDTWGHKIGAGALEYAGVPLGENDKPQFEKTLPAEEWLRQHQSFGIPGGWGFHEIGAITADSVQSDLTEALLAGDSEKLLELYREEEQGAGRTDVLDQIERALATLDAKETAAAP